MKRHSWIFVMMIALLACACNNKKKTAPVLTPTIEKETVADSTVYGTCGENTAMHTLELITDKGDSIVYLMEDTDSFSVVKGGLFVGDKIAVVSEKNAEGTLVAKEVINLTSLLGKWVSLDKNFDIREGGEVISTIKEPRPYTEWKILNGKLVLSADTFDIYSLGADSLYLENAEGIFGYKRITKEAKSK
ncbi:MAG: hypothetical protein Q4D41_08970 [Prevotellaceae bacterium]|nr:hypothetical protein [Prevotellaceae bacterium]